MVLWAILPGATVLAQSIGTPSGQARLELAKQAEVANELPKALAQLDTVLQLAIAEKDTAMQAEALMRTGLLHQRKGDYNVALSSFYRVQQLYETSGNERGLAEVWNNIGSVHHYQKNYRKAQEYYTLGLGIEERLGSPRGMGKFHNNFGALAEDMGEPAEALGHHRRALAIWKQIGDRTWEAVCYANMASCYILLEQRDTARAYLKRSMLILDEVPNRYLLGTVCNRLGVTYLVGGPPKEALHWCGEGLAVARSLGVMPMEQASCECLYQAHGQLGHVVEELKYYRRFVLLRDSIFSTQHAQDITRVEMNHLFERRQLADSLQRAQEQLRTDLEHKARIATEKGRRNVMLYSAIGLLLLAGGLWSRLRYTRRSRALVRTQRDRADALLHNILPVRVAEELKVKGSVEAREYATATVLFADLEDFTSIAERLSPTQLVDAIDTCFRAFDGIMGKHGVEKIKTVGDAYLAAGGVPEEGRGRPLDVVRAGLDMQEFMLVFQLQRSAKRLPAFVMRVGIHTGPVVGGVVGSHKFAFDIWGDAVNTASRMQSCGSIGRVNLSEATYHLVKDEPELRFIPRGPIEAKGKGPLPMYWVERAP